MKIEYEILFFLILSTLSYIFDNQKCNNGNIILWSHHSLNIFANFGWLSNNKYILLIYLFAPIITIIHWLTNNNKCFLTEMHNSICKNDNKMFNDLFNIIGLKKLEWWNKWGHYLYLIIAWFITIHKVNNIYKIFNI